MRINDAPLPAFPEHVYEPDSPIAAWPAKPHPILQRLPVYAITWDDEDPTVMWDAAGDPYRWDASAGVADWIDASCDWISIEIDAGNPDELGLFQASECTLTLDNRTGAYSLYDASGRLVYFAPGREYAITIAYDTRWWYLWRGFVTSWTENIDGTVTVVGHDRFAPLAREIGEYTPGTAGERPRERLRAIAQRGSDTSNWRADPGDVTLTRQLTDRAPLEEMEVVALSDGGQLFVDSDGVWVYRDRLWPRGRADQAYIPVFSDNVCDAVVVWDAELTTDDEHLANSVTLTNETGTVVEAVTTDPTWGFRYPLTHPDPDQWTTTGEGQALADVLLKLYDNRAVGVRSFALHLTDPNQDLWRDGIDRRLGDRIRFLHDYPAAGGSTGSFDIAAVVSTLAHQITPDGWIVTIGTWPAIAAVVVERWDRTTWDWDTPGAQWDYGEAAA